MKKRAIIHSLVIATVLFSPAVNRAFAEDSDRKGPSQAELQAQAKVTEAQARELALSKAPGGTIKGSELEEENGHLIWSFDISMPDTKNITEVNVDAKTGAIIAVDVETPKDQEKEAAADKKAANESKEKDEKDEKDEDEKDPKKGI